MRSPTGSGGTRELLRPVTAKSSGSFRRFPREAFSFLSDLSRTNNKAWFDAHRGIYDAAVVGPALAFVESLGAALKAVAVSVKAEPRIGGSLFRIHRDTGFSADRSPYKRFIKGIINGVLEEAGRTRGPASTRGGRARAATGHKASA